MSMLEPCETFSKYDVLVEPPFPGSSTDYSLAKHNEHVGNQRFWVLLNMKRKSFGEAHMRHDHNECCRIVDDIIDTVCNQVVPRGRFLVSKNVVVGDGMPVLKWEIMDISVLKLLVHKALEPIDIATPTALTDRQDDVSSFAAMISQEGLSFDNGDSTQTPFAFPPPLSCGNMEDGQKRRRRSSLLRRSNSETMVGMVLDNRKKLHHNASDRRGGIQEEPASWKSVSPARHLNRMDVVFTPSGDALDPCCVTVGNNRLHILSAVRSGQFRGGTIDEQESILDEMVETVYVFWKGRILSGTEGDGYNVMSKEQAREAIRRILSSGTMLNLEASFLASNSQGQCGETGEIDRFRPERVISTSEGGTTRLLGQGIAPLPLTVHLNAKKPPALIEDAQKNQNRALMDLRKQKARNQNASRLMEKLGVRKKTSSPLTSTSGDEVPLFPIGGKMQPSSLGTSSPHGTSHWFPSLNYAGLPRSPLNPTRESTVFSKIDTSAMENLVRELDVSDCNDDFDDPLPL